MGNPKDAKVLTGIAIPVDPDALAILKKQVAGGLNAPVDEKVRAKDFSDFLIDFEGETR